ERHELVELLARLGLARQHVVHALEELEAVLYGRAFDALRHQRRRRDRDRAARALEADVGDLAVVETHIQREPIAAKRVYGVDDAVRARQLAEIARLAVVVEDDLAVELVELAHAKISWARFKPAIRRSTSDSSLYSANDARAVAATP